MIICIEVILSIKFTIQYQATKTDESLLYKRSDHYRDDKYLELVVHVQLVSVAKKAMFNLTWPKTI